MEPNTITAEALRWLVIAEKLLSTRDLVGSKTFAIRARESDPRLEYADQILAVADTLLASEKRINNQPDWYAILQLARPTHDSELIATQYRRLALLLNPNKNKFVFADQAFRIVVDAWSVLSNPSKKSLYDNELNFFLRLNPTGPSREQEHQEQPLHNRHHQQQQNPPPQNPPQQNPVRQNPRRNNDSNNNEMNTTEEGSVHSAHGQTSSFWTACPYCYNMYEYPRVYAECTLRCQNCRRAFQAVIIPSPPTISDGKGAYFCSWGYFPLGISNLEKNKGGGSNWSPFSPMFACPQVVGEDVNFAGPKNAPKNANVRKNPVPRIYIDDQDVFVEVSESSDDSDDEWGKSRRKKKKKAKNVKGKKGSARKKVKKLQAEKAKNVKGGGDENLEGGLIMKEGAGPANVSVTETGKKAAANNAKKQTGKVAKELGKLDLNVEFSNEVEEPASGVSEPNGAGNGEEDNIEGIGFFEGLDEFLSSLPILSVVNDDKVKAT